MAYRTFVDKDGAYWQVWDSQPSKMERRVSQSDRRHLVRYPWRGVERREGGDRRVISQRRITLSEGYGSGWLTFESLEEKRRLTPIPNGWDEISQAELRILCDKAKRVAKIDGGTMSA
jgi:hypothetical protein